LKGLWIRYRTVYGDDQIIYAFETDHPTSAERDCHNHFNDYRVNGELFKRNGLVLYLEYLGDKYGEYTKINKTAFESMLKSVKSKPTLQSISNEDISFITKTQYIEMINNSINESKLISKMINFVHFNEAQPQNHNIIYQDPKSTYAKAYINNKWRIMDVDNIKTVIMGQCIVKLMKLKDKYTDVPKECMIKADKLIRKLSCMFMINTVKYINMADFDMTLK
jgi:hypothetical protein